jgi:Tol biopolymer transport system component
MEYYWPLPSWDGKRIFVAGYQPRNEFLRYDLESRRYQPLLPGVSGDYLEFSKDAKWVAYVSVPGGSLFRAAADGSQGLQLTAPPLIAELPHWSPDGKRIAFAGNFPNQPHRVYVVNADGSGLRQVTHGEGGENGDQDPSWSPDGASLVFSQLDYYGVYPREDFFHVVDLNTNRVSGLPGSEGMTSPRWSPDGRYIAGLSPGGAKLLLYDLRTHTQSQLYGGESEGPSWSWDGEYLFFNDGYGNSGWASRVRISDRKVERVTNLHAVRIAGWGWLAAAPNNSFVTAVEAGLEEIFALDWEAP